MTREEMKRQLHEGMRQVSVSPQLRRQALDAMRGKEQKPIMKRKISAALVVALLIVAMCAVALAVASRAGILDFVGRYAGSYIPEDAADYVQEDVATLESELVTANVRELYYDGRTLRMTVDVTPKAENTLLVAEGLMLKDRWQNLVGNMGGEWDESDTRTVLDVYKEKGFSSALCINIWTTEEETGNISGGSMDYTLGEDGVLTVFEQVEFMEDQPQRDIELHIVAIPFANVEADEIDYENRKVTECELSLTAAQLATAEPAQEGVIANTYVNTQPVVYESVGVRVDRLLIEVKPQEIYATIEYTVIDAEKYAVTDDGLYFEYVDPSSMEEEYYNQRLASGLAGGGGVTAMDEAGTMFRQTETLGRNELHDVYTVRAYECWEKERFETHEIAVRPATAEDMK